MNRFNFRSKQAGGLTRYKHMQTIKKQRGAIAIEFAALFTIFFVIVYAIIAYSIPLLLTTTFKQVSSDAGRAAVSVDLALKYSEYEQKVSEEVTKVVEGSWLPSSWVSPCDGQASYGSLSFDENSDRYTLKVCLQREYGSTGSASQRAIIPTINILGMKIPNLPEVDGKTVIRSHTTVRL